MICLFSRLFHEDDNKNKSTLLRAKSLPFIFSSNLSWYLYKRDLQSSSIISCFITNHNFYFITLCAHSTNFFRIFRRNKIHSSPNSVLQLIILLPELTLNFIGALSSFFKLFKYGLILSKYSSGDNFLSCNFLLVCNSLQWFYQINLLCLLFLCNQDHHNHNTFWIC